MNIQGSGVKVRAIFKMCDRAERSGTLSARMGTLSVEKQEKLEADAAKAERKADKKAEAEAKKKEAAKVRPSHYIRF